MGVSRGWFTTTADVFNTTIFTWVRCRLEQYWLTHLLTVAFAVLTLFLVYRLTGVCST
jgi:hypothetical protein